MCVNKNTCAVYAPFEPEGYSAAKIKEAAIVSRLFLKTICSKCICHPNGIPLFLLRLFRGTILELGLHLGQFRLQRIQFCSK